MVKLNGLAFFATHYFVSALKWIQNLSIGLDTYIRSKIQFTCFCLLFGWNKWNLWVINAETANFSKHNVVTLYSPFQVSALILDFLNLVIN